MFPRGLTLAIEGTNQVRSGNKDFAAPTREYTVKAIELIEADKRPVKYRRSALAGIQNQMAAAALSNAGLSRLYVPAIKKKPA